MRKGISKEHNGRKSKKEVGIIGVQTSSIERYTLALPMT